jgi:hypothetical protein
MFRYRTYRFHDDRMNFAPGDAHAARQAAVICGALNEMPGSLSWIRTNGRSINSRELYR